MTPQDITIFQVLAGLFTFSFMAMSCFILIFMLRLQEARNRLLSLAVGLERGIDPILADLRAGAAQFRSAGEHVNHSAGQLAEFGNQAVRLTSFTKTGAKGIWALLAQAAGAFLKN
jgi:hypothetical protein